MGTRIKTNSVKLKSLDDVNLALRDIGLAEKELEVIDTEAHKLIAEIKTKAVKDGENLRTKIAEISAKIQAYADYNQDELFKDRKSIELSFGVFGYRKSTKISIKKTTLDLLKKLSMTKFIRVKEEVNKDAMSDLSQEDLEQVDAFKKVSNDFFCQANSEEINKDLLKSSL
ncbi:MAG: host-nuclease inhibitor Gam family protein [Treponemataceae bacterium]